MWILNTLITILTADIIFGFTPSNFSGGTDLFNLINSLPFSETLTTFLVYIGEGLNCTQAMEIASGNMSSIATTMHSKNSLSTILVSTPLNEALLSLTFQQVSDMKELAGAIIILPRKSRARSGICGILKEKYIESTQKISITNAVFVLRRESKIVVEIYSIKGQIHCNEILPTFLSNILNILPRRQDFAGSKIVGISHVAKIWTEFEVEWDEYVNGTISNARGSAVNIFQDLKYALNFSGEYKSGRIKKFPNGTLHGLTIDLLRNGSADIGISQMRITPEPGIRFLQPTYHDRVRAYFRQPPGNTLNDIYTQPFHFSVWAAIFLTWALLGVSTKIISTLKFSNAEEIQEASFDVEAKENGFMWIAGLMCMQGSSKSPNTSILRLVFICGAFNAVLIYLVYSGTIISTLTVETIPIQTFKDLISSQLDIYGDRSHRRIKRILNVLQKDDALKTLKHTRTFKEIGTEEGPIVILKNQAAFLQVSRHFYLTANQNGDLTNQQLCSISSVPAQYTQSPNAMIISSESPFRELFNYKIIQLKERGLNFRYSKEFSRASGIQCLSSRTMYREDLGLRDVFTAFMILGFGIMVSVLNCGAEKIFKSLRVRLNDQSVYSQGTVFSRQQ